MAEPVAQQFKVKKGGTIVSETIVTDTTTNIRDVGLTGAAAVDTFRAATFAGTEQTRLGLQTTEKINQQAGANFEALIGGAGRVTETAFQTADNFFARSLAASDNILDQTSAIAAREVQGAQAARASAERQLDRVQLGGESPEDRNKTLLLLVGGVILAVIATGAFNK